MLIARVLTLSGLLTATLAAAEPASASEPIVRSVAASGPPGLQATVDQFRADLGGQNHGSGGAFADGRREINWDGVPDASAAPNRLPADFFGVTAPRGLFLRGPDGAPGAFAVSADASNPTATPVRFADVNATYLQQFQPFSPSRLFTAAGTVTTDLVFRTPLTGRRAAVKGFGVVFTDVERPGGTRVRAFDENGKALASVSAVGQSNGLSFVGVVSTDERRIAAVQLLAGTVPLGADETPDKDVVAMDDFIYGEPQPIAAGGRSFEQDADGFSLDPAWATSDADQHSGKRALSVAAAATTGDHSAVSPPLTIPADADSPRLTFHHRFQLEFGFDGGVVETSIDDGASWQPLPDSAFLEAGPDATLRSTGTNPVRGRRAFTGTTDGRFRRVQIDLARFRGRTLRVRFRLGTDASTGGLGWVVDDVDLTGADARVAGETEAVPVVTPPLVPDTRADVTGPSEPPVGDHVGPKLSAVQLVRAGRRATVRFRVDEAARVEATFRRARGGARVRTLVKSVRAGRASVSTRLRRGRYRVTLRATDRAGNRSRAAVRALNLR